LACLHEWGYFGDIDLIYVPIDFKRHPESSFGFGVLNFRTPQACSKFMAEFHLACVCDKLVDAKSKKLFEVDQSLIQGQQVNIQRLLKSPVLANLKRYPAWLPRVIDAGGLSTPLEAKRTKNSARRQSRHDPT
jgi:hypothetical protein